MTRHPALGLPKIPDPAPANAGPLHQAANSGIRRSSARTARKILRHPKVRRLSWTFLNQGVVSAGSFVVQVVLARRLAAADYGIFALIMGGLLTLQLCNATLIFHPMSVRIPAATDDERPKLLGASLLLVGVLSVALAAVLAVGLLGFGQADLIPSTLLFFLAWQMQEALRRGLLVTFRHSTAIAGDTVMYAGQALIVLGLSLAGSLTIEGTMQAMGISAALGAIVHARHLRLALPGAGFTRSTVDDFWSIGGLASLGNGLLVMMRVLILPWALAAISGPAATGGYQACANIVNLSNPLILGLGNVIPQVASSASMQGNAHAWRTTRGYALIAAPPIVLYTVAVLAAPMHVLRLFYGSNSAFLALGWPIRLLILGGLANFAIEIVSAFLHGIASVRRAAKINMIGLIAIAIVAGPLIGFFGLVGGCAAVLLANLVRLAVARWELAQVTAPAAPVPA